MKKTHISWDVFQADCNIAATKAISNNIKFDAIIAIGRGGVVPARIMAEIVKPTDFYVIGLRLYDGYKAGGKVEMYQDIPSDAAFDRHSKILIVDDISDTGTTLNYAFVQMYIGSGGGTIRTACPYMKVGTTREPTSYSKCFPKDEWLIFPFERD
tara:strand:- start:530 stop:994 length:465 start_codon:yes stop_codon:yes gene_type:complete